jgi:hypothetical protein
MLKSALLILSLSVGACGSVPRFPQVEQCAYSVKFNKFRCVNVKTKAKRNVSRESKEMEGAQCLSINDYKQAETWLATVKEMAERKCR